LTALERAARKELVKKLVIASGEVMAATVYHIDKVEAWIKTDGCDLELDVLPAVERVGASALQSKGPGVLTTWTYFDRPVHAARDRRLAGGAEPKPRVNGYRREPQQQEEWQKYGLPKGCRIAD
jgi:hypothetical protein